MYDRMDVDIIMYSFVYEIGKWSEILNQVQIYTNLIKRVKQMHF